MKRIDFLGAPGVGKTTLYKELLRSRKKIDSWITPEEAKIRIARKYLKENKNISHGFKKLLILNSPFLRKFHFF